VRGFFCLEPLGLHGRTLHGMTPLITDRPCWVAALLALTNTLGHAQVTVNSTDLPQGGTTYTFQNALPDFGLNLESTGPGWIWDFSDMEVQDSPFQLYLRNSKLFGMQAAQTWRNEELMPNVRFSKIRWRGTINPMMGPATYHGQGWLTHSTSAFMAAKVPPCFGTQRPLKSHITWALSTCRRAPKPTCFWPPTHIPSLAQDATTNAKGLWQKAPAHGGPGDRHGPHPRRLSTRRL